ncbi:Hypothetical predicted protein [Scomber scombrus]|uniref:Uncharacterized protein n=1 Tax=Scomber scombrus TaxID=13677 RepID=A0AAV1P401_SCOSC
MHQRAGERRKITVINDSAARHLSIDSPTPINESWRSLCFIKVATYEILKRARQQHNTALQRAGRDLPLKESKEEEEEEERKKKDRDGNSRRNSADSRKDSGNTHISVSETEAA